ncbi:MAG: extracellular solute-binding protein [Treponema sp.]|jgi:ABC-type glycerol-3-phosphate transport system substrate-binding protein|nr:extracellular solute-binding protein [Treponema sp.]
MKSKRFRLLAAALVLVILALMTAACSGGSGDSRSGNITVRIMTRWSDEAPYSVFWRGKIKEFNAQKNGVTIVDESLSDEASFLDKLRSSIATGNQPEVFIEYGGARIVDYVEAGILLDVQPSLDDDPAWRDSFLDDLFDKWRFADYPGTFGIPTQFYAVLLFYNKQMLARAGFNEPPADFDTWRRICDALLARGQQPMTLGEKSNWRAGHFFNNLIMKSYGAQAVTDLANRTLRYDDPRILKLFAVIKEFNEKGYWGPNAVGVDSATEDADFLTNKVAMCFQGSWYIPQITGDYEGDISNIGVARFPYIDPAYRNSYQGGTAESYSISKRSAAVNDASVKVVKYFTNPDYWAEAEASNKGGLYVSKFTTLPGVTIDPVTMAAKALLADAKEFRDDVQTYDPESHMLDTVRAAVQGLFLGNSPEQAGREIIAREQIKGN